MDMFEFLNKQIGQGVLFPGIICLEIKLIILMWNIAGMETTKESGSANKPCSLRSGNLNVEVMFITIQTVYMKILIYKSKFFCTV